MVGFQLDVSKFFIYMMFMILSSLAATSYALAVSTLARTTTMSVTILPMILELCCLFGGFFLSPAKLPKYFSWLDALGYVKYAYVGVALNELGGLDLVCDKPDISKCIRTGEESISLLGLDYITIPGCIGVLLSMIVVFRFIAYVGVRYIKW
jgi:ATP-binding cassette subfamily G (WHITE) protein 2